MKLNYRLQEYSSWEYFSSVSSRTKNVINAGSGNYFQRTNLSLTFRNLSNVKFEDLREWTLRMKIFPRSHVDSINNYEANSRLFAGHTEDLFSPASVMHGRGKSIEIYNRPRIYFSRDLTSKWSRDKQGTAFLLWWHTGTNFLGCLIYESTGFLLLHDVSRDSAFFKKHKTRFREKEKNLTFPTSISQ